MGIGGIGGGADRASGVGGFDGLDGLSGLGGGTQTQEAEQAQAEVPQGSRGGALASMSFSANLLQGLVESNPGTAALTSPGDVEAASSPNWNETGWEDLSAEQRSAFQTLGWTEQSWDLGPPPPSASKAFSELSEQERTAATSLGYTQESWDAENEVSPLRPDGTLDLGPPGSVDKAKVDRLLGAWDQIDGLNETRTDENRCQSNAVVAALLKKGGLPELKHGLENARTEARSALEDARAQTPPDQARIGRLESAIQTFDDTIRAIDENRVTPQQLDRSADALFKTFSQWPTKAYPEGAKQGQAIDPFDESGTAVGSMFSDNIHAMERAVGLTSSTAPAVVDGRSPAEVSDKIWTGIQPGQSAHVAVRGEGELLWRGQGMHGEPLQPPNGPPYTHYTDSESGARVDLTGSPNHAVVFGRSEDGSRYIYNPMGSPPYITENKNDPNSVAAFDERARMLMGKDRDGPFARVTPFAEPRAA